MFGFSSGFEAYPPLIYGMVLFWHAAEILGLRCFLVSLLGRFLNWWNVVQHAARHTRPPPPPLT